MKTASDRLSISDAPDVLGPKEVGRIAGVAARTAYEWFELEGFPGKKYGKKYLVTKRSFIEWLENGCKNKED